MPYIGRSTDGFGVRNRFLYLASADDTSVSGADANGATLTFTDGAYVDVYLNGVLLKAGTDYNTNTANTIASLAAMAANDEVTVVVYDIFTTADMVSATSGGTFTGGVTFNGAVTLGSTVSGLDVNGTEIILDADADTSITADTDDEIHIKIGGADDFKFKANTLEVQTGSNIDMNGTELILDADADTSITADTDDRIDFRFGGTDSVYMDVTGVGVNVSNPLYPVHVKAASGGDTAAALLQGPSNGYSALYMGDVDDVDVSMILYGHANNEWKLFVGANKVFEIDGANRTIKFEMAAGNGNINAYNNNIYLASTTGEVYATDSGGNHTQLSPHNFQYIPDGASEVGAWAYMSEKTIPTKETVTEELPNGTSTTKEVIKNERKDGDSFTYVNVDMMKVVREVEKLTGTKLVYTGTDGKDDGSTVKDDIIAGLIKRIEALEGA